MAERTKRSRPVERKTAAPTKKKTPIGLILIGGSVVVVLLVVVLFVVLNQPAQVTASNYEEIPADWIDRTAIGSPDAPVTIQAWEDFRCPACASWNQTVKPQLLANEVANGQVRLEFHHFPLSQHEPGASMAAQASECAADQGAFWPYHDRLFAAQNEGANAYLAENLIKYAEELGLDKDQFTQCLTGQEHLADVQASLNQAIAQNLRSTPTVILNGVPVDNPMDYQALSAEIARLVAAAGG
ncbi:MAG: DsbA family protein [Caldilineae bacterium]|nr:MAG: DsbA family protein [Caldilineae bacterium]